jgi:hypothetical protein
MPHSLEKAGHRSHSKSYRNYYGHVRVSVFDILPLSLTAHSCALAFCIPVLPTSLARWFLIIDDDDKPFGTPVAQFSLKAIFSLSGVADVLVFYVARDRRLLLFDSPELAYGQAPQVNDVPMAQMAYGQAPQPNVTPLEDIQPLGSDLDSSSNLGEQTQNGGMAVTTDLHRPMPGDEGVPINV